MFLNYIAAICFILAWFGEVYLVINAIIKNGLGIGRLGLLGIHFILVTFFIAFIFAGISTYIDQKVRFFVKED